MVKKFTIPFASQGDANDIPDALQVDGKVSFTQGFGYDYERPYDDPQAKDIVREDMNGLFKAITSAVGELQTLGASEWSSAISYPKGAIVYHEKDLYISQVDDNQNKPPQGWVSITSIANDSLKKAANLSDLTDKATARNNLGLGSSATLNKTDTLGASTSLVATQKLVNDTKINLENSKQDKLTFTGTGNVARMSEVEKKVDKTTLSDTGFDKTLAIATNTVGNYSAIYSARPGFDSPPGAYDYGSLLNMHHGFSGDNSQIYIEHERGRNLYFRSSVIPDTWKMVLNNTHISQSTGSSTTKVMSQKAVSDLVKLNTASKNQNGWWKCGDTGIVVQWGYASSSTVHDIIFPVSFTNMCCHISLDIDQSATQDIEVISTRFDRTTLSGFSAGAASVDSRGVKPISAPITWFAIGY